MKIIDQRPELFVKSKASIWTDPYIQKNMLEAHINLSSDAGSRRAVAIRTVVNFIDSNIPRGSDILDLGCGPGLYAELLTLKGHHITGIDINKASIEYAIRYNKDIKFIEGDYITQFPEGRYDAVMMIYCDMGTLSDVDRDKLLENCYTSLKEQGVLIFDVFNEKIATERKEESTWEYAPDGGFWSPHPYLLLKQVFHYPENHTFAYQYNVLTEKESNHFIVWERYYTEKDIAETLERAGFKEIEFRCGLLKGNNFTSDNVTFVVAER